MASSGAGAPAGDAAGDGGRVRALQQEVEGVKSIMTQNVERILARGENLEQLQDKSQHLQATVRRRAPGTGHRAAGGGGQRLAGGHRAARCGHGLRGPQGGDKVLGVGTRPPSWPQGP